MLEALVWYQNQENHIAKNDIIHEMGRNTVYYYPTVGISLSFPGYAGRSSWIAASSAAGPSLPDPVTGSPGTPAWMLAVMKVLEIESIPGKKDYILPCISEEVMLYLCQEVSALWIAVIAEFIKRRYVRLVNGLVPAFIPVGRFARAISPLIDAALYLITARTLVGIQGD